MHLVISIKLGNAAMENGRDVAGLLRTLAEQLEDSHTDVAFDAGSDYGTGRDLNGNTVMNWWVST